jgi:hypothetical protein
MLTNDFLQSLPDDPELAFVALVDHLDEWLEGLKNSGGWGAERKYADTLRAFVDEYKLDVPISRCGSDDHEHLQDWWQGFLADVTYAKGRYQFRH